jgi:hypothetical protein
VTPAPGQAAAAAPAPTATPITATCSLGDHPGVDDDEARTAADVICHELAQQRATDGVHEVRFGKLGGKTLVTVASRNGNAYDERRTFLTGMDEIHVASPRLVSALVEGRPLEDTRTVDNVLSSETRQLKVQSGSMGFEGTMFGMTGVGSESGASAGLGLGLLYRAGNLGASWSGRAGGIGSGEKKLGSASLDVGGRLYASTADFAPFIGGGFGLSYFQLNREIEGDLSGSGFGAFVQAGAEVLRSHHTAFSMSIRADLPFYSLQGSTETYSNDGYKTNHSTAYVVPLSFNVALLFH